MKPGKDCKKVGPHKTSYCSVKRFEKDLEACHDCADHPEIEEKRPMLTLDLNNISSEEVCVRTRPVYDDHRPLSQNLEVALTPRELFFRDLYESVFETDSTITNDFIQKEREHSSRDLESTIGSLSSAISWEVRSKTSLSSSMYKSSLSDPPVNRRHPEGSIAETELNGNDEVSEFFVANVTHKQSVTSEAFLYVSGECEQPKKVVRNVVSIHSEDDDVFQK